jgi:hypothetical protein
MTSIKSNGSGPGIISIHYLDVPAGGCIRWREISVVKDVKDHGFNVLLGKRVSRT